MERGAERVRLFARVPNGVRQKERERERGGREGGAHRRCFCGFAKEKAELSANGKLPRLFMGPRMSPSEEELDGRTS